MTFAGGGYLFGAAMETIFAKHQKWAVVLGLAAVLLVVWVVRLVRRRMNRTNNLLEKQAEDPGAKAEDRMT